MNQPLVSILIPVYNREKLVVMAIESSLGQTYENIEIIAVDNKSTDGTYEVLKEYQAKYANIRVYQNEENIGPVRNWRKCLEYSSGEFVKILFSDDWIEETFAEKCVEILLSDMDIGFVFTCTLIHSMGKLRTAYRFSRKSAIYSADLFIKKSLLYAGCCPVSPSNALFRREDVEDNLLVEVANDLGLEFGQFGAGNDMLLFLLTASKYPFFGNISEPLAHFLGHEKSLTISNDLRLYYMLARKYFVSNFTTCKNLKKDFHSMLWLRNLQDKGLYDRLIEKEHIDILTAIKEMVNDIAQRVLQRIYCARL